jgi:hypothetical protein
MEKLRDQNFYFHSFLHTSSQRDIINVRFDVRFYQKKRTLRWGGRLNSHNRNSALQSFFKKIKVFIWF